MVFTFISFSFKLLFYLFQNQEFVLFRLFLPQILFFFFLSFFSYKLNLFYYHTLIDFEDFQLIENESWHQKSPNLLLVIQISFFFLYILSFLFLFLFLSGLCHFIYIQWSKVNSLVFDLFPRFEEKICSCFLL